jgi:hypothetical protein
LTTNKDEAAVPISSASSKEETGEAAAAAATAIFVGEKKETRAKLSDLYWFFLLLFSY